MRYNLGHSLLAGLIIGGVLGGIFYIVPAKLMISGPIPAEHILLPEGVQSFILLQTFYWGVIPGLIIGLFGGLNTNATLPRGHFSKCIGVWCYLVCTVTAWATQWEYLEYTSGGRIAIIVAATLVMFFACLFISQAVSFIEAIRE